MRRSFPIFLGLFIFLVFSGRGAIAAGDDPPVLVTSDRLTIEGEKNIAVFSGDVRATREGMTIRAKELVVHYRSSPAVAEVSGPGDVDRITARGNVEILKEGRRVTGDEAVFLSGERKVVITGHAVLEDGKNVIEGPRIVYLLDKNLGTVEGTEKNRVKATLFPDRQ